MKIISIGACAPEPRREGPLFECCEKDPIEETLSVESVDGAPKYEATYKVCRTCRHSWLIELKKKAKKAR